MISGRAFSTRDGVARPRAFGRVGHAPLVVLLGHHGAGAVTSDLDELLPTLLPPTAISLDLRELTSPVGPVVTTHQAGWNPDEYLNEFVPLLFRRDKPGPLSRPG